MKQTMSQYCSYPGCAAFRWRSASTCYLHSGAQYQAQRDSTFSHLPAAHGPGQHPYNTGVHQWQYHAKHMMASQGAAGSSVASSLQYYHPGSHPHLTVTHPQGSRPAGVLSQNPQNIRVTAHNVQSGTATSQHGKSFPAAAVHRPSGQVAESDMTETSVRSLAMFRLSPHHQGRAASTAVPINSQHQTLRGKNGTNRSLVTKPTMSWHSPYASDSKAGQSSTGTQETSEPQQLQHSMIQQESSEGQQEHRLTQHINLAQQQPLVSQDKHEHMQSDVHIFSQVASSGHQINKEQQKDSNSSQMSSCVQQISELSSGQELATGHQQVVGPESRAAHVSVKHPSGTHPDSQHSVDNNDDVVIVEDDDDVLFTGRENAPISKKSDSPRRRRKGCVVHGPGKDLHSSHSQPQAQHTLRSPTLSSVYVSPSQQVQATPATPAPPGDVQEVDSDEDCIILDFTENCPEISASHSESDSLLSPGMNMTKEGTGCDDQHNSLSTVPETVAVPDPANTSLTDTTDSQPPSEIIVFETVSLSELANYSVIQASEAKSYSELSAESYYRCGCFSGRCGFHTVMPTLLELHLQEVHPNDNMYPCVHCGSQEAGHENLMIHLEHHLSMHTQSLYCSEISCEFSSFSPEEVLSHMGMCHQSLNSYICWRCKSRFDSLPLFIMHVKQNLITLFRCSLCSAKDVDRQAILTHISSSHPDLDCMVGIQKVLLCQERKMSGWGTTESETAHGPVVMETSQPLLQPQLAEGKEPLDLAEAWNAPVNRAMEVISTLTARTDGTSMAQQESDHAPIDVATCSSIHDEQNSPDRLHGTGQSSTGTDMQSKEGSNASEEGQSAGVKLTGEESKNSPHSEAEVDECLNSQINNKRAKADSSTESIADVALEGSTIETNKVGYSGGGETLVQMEVGEPLENRMDVSDQTATTNKVGYSGGGETWVQMEVGEPLENRMDVSDQTATTNTSHVGDETRTSVSATHKGTTDEGAFRSIETGVKTETQEQEYQTSEADWADTEDSTDRGNDIKMTKTNHASDLMQDNGGAEKPDHWLRQTYTCRVADGDSEAGELLCQFCSHVSTSSDGHVKHMFVLHRERFKGFSCQQCTFLSVDAGEQHQHRCAPMRRLRSRSGVGCLNEKYLSILSPIRSSARISSAKVRTLASSGRSKKTLVRVKTEFHTSKRKGSKSEKDVTGTGSGFAERWKRSEPKMSCNLCGVNGNSYTHMQLHLYKEHSTVMMCPYCTATPGNDRLLYLHFLKQHPDHLNRFELVKSQNYISSIASSQGVKEIDQAGNREASATHDNSASFDGTMKINTEPAADDYTMGGASSDTMADPVQDPSGSSHSAEKQKTAQVPHCKLCSFSHPQLSELRAHVYKNHREVMKCPRCQFHPSSDKHLFCHIGKMHKAEKLSLISGFKSLNWIVCPPGYSESKTKQPGLSVKRGCAEMGVAESGVEKTPERRSKRARRSPQRSPVSAWKTKIGDSMATAGNMSSESGASTVPASHKMKTRLSSSPQTRHASPVKRKAGKLSPQTSPTGKAFRHGLFQCKLCSFSIRSRGSSFKHVFAKHPEVVQCTLCHTTNMKSALQLRKHAWQIHPEDKNLYSKLGPANWVLFPGDSPSEQNKMKESANVQPGISNTPAQSESPGFQQIGKVSPLGVDAITSHSSMSVLDHSSAPASLTGSESAEAVPIVSTEGVSQSIEPPAGLLLPTKVEWDSSTPAADNNHDFQSDVAAMMSSARAAIKSSDMPPVSGEEEIMEYRCPHCTSDFKLHYRFYEHLCYHYHYRCFKCVHCSFLAFASSAVLNHSKRTHTEEPDFQHLTKQTFEARIARVMQNNYFNITAPYTERRLLAYERARLKKMVKDSEKLAKKQMYKTSKGSPRKLKGQSRPKLKVTKKIVLNHEARKIVKKHVKVRKAAKNSSSKPGQEGWLQCPYCRAEKKSRINIEREIRFHIHYKPFCCPYCEMSSSSEIFIPKHIAKTHPDKKISVRYERIEGKETRFKMLFERALTMSGLPVKGETRGVERSDHVEDQVIEVQCPSCPFVCADRDLLSSHITKSHEIQREDGESHTEGNLDAVLHSAEKSYTSVPSTQNAGDTTHSDAVLHSAENADSPAPSTQSPGDTTHSDAVLHSAENAHSPAPIIQSPGDTTHSDAVLHSAENADSPAPSTQSPGDTTHSDAVLHSVENAHSPVPSTQNVGDITYSDAVLHSEENADGHVPLTQNVGDTTHSDAVLHSAENAHSPAPSTQSAGDTTCSGAMPETGQTSNSTENVDSTSATSKSNNDAFSTMYTDDVSPRVEKASDESPFKDKQDTVAHYVQNSGDVPPTDNIKDMPHSDENTTGSLSPTEQPGERK